MPEFLKWGESSDGEVTESMMSALTSDINISYDPKWLNMQLYQVLSLNVEGVALGVIKSLEDMEETNGINAWLRLSREYVGVTGQRMAGLVARIFSPKRAAKYGDASQAISNWELNVKEFERGSKSILVPYLKIYGLKQVCPLELERDITRLSSTLTTFEAVKEYAIDQVGLRRDPHFSGAASAKPTPMECDGIWPEEKEERPEEESESGIYGFQKGKGKGGKGFQGKCYHCDKYGHRVNQCPVKDQEMAKYRQEKGQGKGKGDGSGKGKGGGYHSGYQPKGQSRSAWGGKGAYWFDEAPDKPSWNDGQQAGWPAPGVHHLSRPTLASTPKPAVTRGTAKVSTSNRFSALEVIEEDELPLEECTHVHFGEVDLVQAVPSTPTAAAAAAPSAPVAVSPATCDESMPPASEWSGVVSGRKRRPRFAGTKPASLCAFWKAASSKPCCPVEAIPVGVRQPQQQQQPQLQQQQPQVVAAVNYKREESGWTCVRVIPDSGAVESVAPCSMAPAYQVQQSEGSSCGQMYATASGDEIPNQGEQVLPSVAENGMVSKHRWQLAPVTRPLASVGELCDAGNRVVFGKSGGMIENVKTGTQTFFTREQGTYLLDMWIPPVQEGNALLAGFPRPVQ